MLELCHAIAKAIGLDYDTLYSGRHEYLCDGDERHNINIPMKPDIEEAAEQVMEVLAKCRGRELDGR